MKTLIIDNYDSYTYNLFQLVWSVSGTRPLVIKNDELSFEDIKKLPFDNIILSPGPGRPDQPKDFGVCREIIEKLDCPILGVCLGHQGIADFFGGTVVKATTCVHGLTSEIEHSGNHLFENIPSPFRVMRYHSLVVENIKPPLRVTATTKDGIIMAIEHEKKPIFGVQFHPESIASEYGREIIRNFNDITKKQKPYVTSHSIPFKWTDEAVFDTLQKLDPQIVWLDSSKIVADDSRYSIFGLSSKRSHILSYDSEKQQLSFSGNMTGTLEMSLWEYLENFLAHNKEDSDLVFSLGYIGYLGYELKGECDGSYAHKSEIPDSMLKFVDRAVIIDHEKKKLLFVYYSDDYFTIETFEENPTTYDKKPFPKTHLEVSKEDYIEDIYQCLEKINTGESYEICLTNRLILDDTPDPGTYYKLLRKESPGQYTALLLFDPLQICSSSMERFLRIRNRIVDTKPIKGTLPRGKDEQEDQEMIRSLKNDERFHAENLMIVDLLRNDLGKVCKKDSVIVSKLLDVETFPTVHQLVSTVCGELEDDQSVIDCIKATFPGGSMTGAPKKRTMEIIDALEHSARGVYSGTIGYLSLNGNVDLNIVIRTSVIANGKTTIGVGGAIIALSDPEEEYEEILLKASGSLKALKKYYEIEQ